MAKGAKPAEIEVIGKIGELNILAGKSDHFEMRLKTQAEVNKALAKIQELAPDSLTVGRASLEDLFIELTGKNIEGGENA